MDEFATAVARLHKSEWVIGLHATGSGSRLLEQLLTQPGASQTVIEAAVPYDHPRLEVLLGHSIPKAVCGDVAVALAKRGREIARRSRPSGPVMGFGCTAALATDRERRGEEQAFLAVATDSRLFETHIAFVKGKMGRDQEENLVAVAGLNVLTRAAGWTDRLAPQAKEGYSLREFESSCGDCLQAFYDGTGAWVTVEPDGRQHADHPPAAAGILPGSFDPLHDGHARMVAVSARSLKGAVDLELSIVNVDKEDIPLADIRRRLDSMAHRFRVHVTRAPTFLEKARLFPGKTWVVGHDTVVRLLAGRYYGGIEERDSALAELDSLGARFLVAGREEGGAFKTLGDVDLPEGARLLFKELPEELFRADISSTAIRSRAAEAI